MRLCVGMTFEELRKKAKRIDSIDMIVGPVAAMMVWSGNEGLQALGVGLDIAELALLKLPYIKEYLSTTKDYQSLWYWVPKELAANLTGIGSLMDITPAYRLRTDYFLNTQE